MEDEDGGEAVDGYALYALALFLAFCAEGFVVAVYGLGGGEEAEAVLEGSDPGRRSASGEDGRQVLLSEAPPPPLEDAAYAGAEDAALLLAARDGDAQVVERVEAVAAGAAVTALHRAHELTAEGLSDEAARKFDVF